MDDDHAVTTVHHHGWRGGTWWTEVVDFTIDWLIDCFKSIYFTRVINNDGDVHNHVSDTAN